MLFWRCPCEQDSNVWRRTYLLSELFTTRRWSWAWISTNGPQVYDSWMHGSLPRFGGSAIPGQACLWGSFASATAERAEDGKSRLEALIGRPWYEWQENVLTNRSFIFARVLGWSGFAGGVSFLFICGDCGEWRRQGVSMPRTKVSKSVVPVL